MLAILVEAADEHGQALRLAIHISAHPPGVVLADEGMLGQRGDHLVDVDPAPLQWIGELVEHIEVVPLLGESAGRSSAPSSSSRSSS